MSCTPLPTFPQKRAPLWCTFFALPAANDPLPTELKFRVAIPAANDPVPTELKFKENTVK